MVFDDDDPLLEFFKYFSVPCILIILWESKKDRNFKLIIILWKEKSSMWNCAKCNITFFVCI